MDASVQSLACVCIVSIVASAIFAVADHVGAAKNSVVIITVFDFVSVLLGLSFGVYY